jgi:hypothetical protein
MELRTYWEATSLSTTQDSPNDLGNPKVHFRGHNNRPYHPIFIF